MTKRTHTTSLTMYIHQYVGSADALNSETPSLACWAFKSNNSCWVVVKEIKIEETIEIDSNLLVSSTLEAIDSEITKKRLELEEELTTLRQRKQDLLLIPYEA